MRTGISLRRRLLLSVIVALAVALVALIGAFNLVLRDRLSHEADSALAARAAAELTSLHVVGGQIGVAEALDGAAPDAQAWVFAGRQVLEAPRGAAHLARAAQQLAGSGRATVEPPGTQTRLYAVPVVADGRRLGTVVSAVSLAPYDDTAATALVASVVLGVLLLAAAALAAGRLISAALRPVAQMTEQAAAWSRIDSGQRFGLGPPRDELTGLAVTLDGLLDRVASSFRHEQRFSAELSHELRSPLSSLIAEAQLAIRHTAAAEQREPFEHILAAAQQMRRTLDTLLAAARAEHRTGSAVGDAAAGAQAAAQGYSGLATQQGITITVEEPPGPVQVGVETDVVERVLAPLIENACRYGSREVTVAVGQRDGSVVITVSDDGPGVPESIRELVFEPGYRNGSAGRQGQGAGLGLSLARRLARAAGGDVHAEKAQRGGRFSVRLPGVR